MNYYNLSVSFNQSGLFLLTTLFNLNLNGYLYIFLALFGVIMRCENKQFLISLTPTIIPCLKTLKSQFPHNFDVWSHPQAFVLYLPCVLVTWLSDWTSIQIITTEQNIFFKFDFLLLLKNHDVLLQNCMFYKVHTGTFKQGPAKTDRISWGWSCIWCIRFSTLSNKCWKREESPSKMTRICTAFSNYISVIRMDHLCRHCVGDK